MADFMKGSDFCFEMMMWQIAVQADEAPAIFTHGAFPDVVFMEELHKGRFPASFLFYLGNHQPRDFLPSVLTGEAKTEVEGNAFRHLPVHQGNS